MLGATQMCHGRAEDLILGLEEREQKTSQEYRKQKKEFIVNHLIYIFLYTFLWDGLLYVG